MGKERYRSFSIISIITDSSYLRGVLGFKYTRYRSSVTHVGCGENLRRGGRGSPSVTSL